MKLNWKKSPYNFFIENYAFNKLKRNSSYLVSFFFSFLASTNGIIKISISNSKDISQPRDNPLRKCSFFVPLNIQVAWKKLYSDNDITIAQDQFVLSVSSLVFFQFFSVSYYPYRQLNFNFYFDKILFDHIFNEQIKWNKFFWRVLNMKGTEIIISWCFYGCVVRCMQILCFCGHNHYCLRIYVFISVWY